MVCLITVRMLLPSCTANKDTYFLFTYLLYQSSDINPEWPLLCHSQSLYSHLALESQTIIHTRGGRSATVTMDILQTFVLLSVAATRYDTIR